MQQQQKSYVCSMHSDMVVPHQVKNWMTMDNIY